MVNDPYRLYAKKYDTFVEPFNTALRQVGMKMFPPKEGMSVLDVGCGTGTTLGYYHDAGCKIYGIDLSPSMLEVARKKLGECADLRLGDASQMPYPNGIFDLVVAMFTLHEMPHKIRLLVMGEIARILKQEGRILLIDYQPGPSRFPKGWLYKAIILFLEITAGREHFKNYRDFSARKGLPNLITSQKLIIEKKKIVGGGNIALFLLSSG